MRKPNIKETMDMLDYASDNDIFGTALAGGLIILLGQLLIYPIWVIQYVGLKIIGRDDIIRKLC